MFDRLPEQITGGSLLGYRSFLRPLVLAPHPDDEVYGCGGLLALWARCNTRPRVVVLTDGKMQAGSRQAESLETARLLGYDITFWDLPDRGLRCTNPLIDAIETELCSFKPDVVLTPTLAEPHPDHQVTTLALVCALARGLARPDVILYESGGTLGRANALVDISEVLELKDRAMAVFASQEVYQPYRSRIAARDHFRALVLGAGAQAAEAFCLAEVSRHGWPVLVPALEPLFLHQRMQAVQPADLPLVSVIVRTFGNPHLELTVASIMAQTYPRIEVVLVDALGAVKPVGLHQRIGVTLRWIEAHRPRTLAEAANTGVSAASGDYLALLDEDCLWTPEHLHKLVVSIQRHAPPLFAVHSDACVVSPDGTEIERFSSAFSLEALKAGTQHFPSHAVLFHKTLTTQRGCKFDNTASPINDLGFWQGVAAHTRIGHVPGVSAISRPRQGIAPLPLHNLIQNDDLHRRQPSTTQVMIRRGRTAVELLRRGHWRAVVDRIGSLLRLR